MMCYALLKEDDDMATFSERLKELRLERNLSQSQLAKETGLCQSCIARGNIYA